eukprot:PhF_6_TR40788/c0_g1_i1/m.61591
MKRGNKSKTISYSKSGPTTSPPTEKPLIVAPGGDTKGQTTTTTNNNKSGGGVIVPTAQDIQIEYQKAIDSIIERTQQKQTVFNGRGVFSENVNAIRAENMVQVAVGKINWANIQRLAKKRAQSRLETTGGAEVGSGGNEKGGGGGGNDQDNTKTKTDMSATNASSLLSMSMSKKGTNKCAEIINQLNMIHEENKSILRKQVEDVRLKDTKDKIAKLQGKPLPSANITSGNTTSSLPTVHRTDNNASLLRKDKTEGILLDNSELTPSSVADSNLDRTGLTPLDPTLVMTMENMPPPTNLEPDVPWSIGEFLEGSYEHKDYPELVQRARLMARRRDEVTRGVTPVDRYTLPRAHMISYRGITSANENASGGDDENPSGSSQMSSNTNASRLAARAMWDRHTASVPSDQWLTSTSLVEMAHQPPESRMHLLREHGQVYQDRINNSLIKAVEGVTPSASPNAKKRGGKSGTKTATQQVSIVDKEREMRKGMFERKKDFYHLLDKNKDSIGSVFHPHAPQEEEDMYQYPSSEEGDLDDEDDDTFDPNAKTDPTALDLLESVTVCLCEEYARKRASSNTRGTSEVAILRNVLVTALRTLHPRVTEIQKQHQQSAGSSLGFDSMDSRQKGAEAESMRTMRSWSKGVEILLTFDLDLMVQPFSTRSSHHIDALAEYYCTLYGHTRRRTKALMQQWRQRHEQKKAAQNHDSIILSRLRGGGGGGTDDAKKEGVEVTKDPAKLARIAQIHSHFEDTLAQFNKETVESMTTQQADVALRSRKLVTQFMEKFGQFIALPANSSSKDILKNGATRSHLRDKLMTFVNVSRDGDVLGRLVANSEISNRNMATLMNVFQHTWIKEIDTSHSENNVQTENQQRAFAAACSYVTMIIDTYMRMACEEHKEQFRRAIHYHKPRTAARIIEEGTENDGNPVALPTYTDFDKSQAWNALKTKDVQEVERTLLQEKYTRPIESKNTTTMTQLRQALQSTDTWSGSFPSHIIQNNDNQTKDGSKETSSGGMGNEGDTNDFDAEVAEIDILPLEKREQVRLRKMQELDIAWTTLRYPMGDKLALFEKWNVTEVKKTIVAAGLWKALTATILAREEALIKVSAIRRGEMTVPPEEATAAVNDMTKYSALADQQLRKIKAVLGETPTFNGESYVMKMKRDFNRLTGVGGNLGSVSPVLE